MNETDSPAKAPTHPPVPSVAPKPDAPAEPEGPASERIVPEDEPTRPNRRPAG